MIKTLIVMTTYGSIFFSKQFTIKEQGTDISLTAGLISAVYSMTTETEGEKIENLDLQNVRTIFKEREGDVLFILTLDKRMDEGDAQDLLSEFMTRFKKKYGKVEIDGRVLSDFEPIVDEVVEEKLWYNNVPEKPALASTTLAFLSLFFAFFWYPMLFLASFGNFNIKDNLLYALSLGILPFIQLLLTYSLFIVIPGLLIYFFIKRSEEVKSTLRFVSEYISRPTRGAYSEILPWWFTLFAIGPVILNFTVVIYGRGFFYFLNYNTLSEGSIQANEANAGYFEFWASLYILVFNIVFSWLVLQPLIIGLMTDNLTKNFMNSSILLSGISLIFYSFGQFFAGTVYQELVGFSPQYEALAKKEATTFKFFFLVSLPVFLVFFIIVFMNGIGFSKLIKRNQNRYPIAYAVSVFIVLMYQLFWFMFIFLSGKFLIPYEVF